MSWLVNPESEDEYNDEEAVLFNAQDSLDFEDNPRGKHKRRKKAGRPKKSKRGGKKKKHRRAKHVIKLIEAPRRRRKAVKHRRRKVKAASKPKRKHHKRRKSTRRSPSIQGLVTKLKKMGVKSSALAGVESNPSWKGQPRRHKKAAKKGWRRRRKAGRTYAENPRKVRRRSYARRPWKARVYKQNPFSMGGIKGKIFGPNWYNLPNMAQIKYQPWHALGFGILGVVDTSLIGMGIDYAFTKYKGKVKIPEPAKDITRIIVGKVIGGSLISFGIAKVSKNTMWAKFHQTGVYVSTILDVVGTSIKYIMRAVKAKGKGGKKVKIGEEGIPFQPHMSAGRFAASMMGMGSIMGAWEEQKLLASIQADGIVVATNGGGQVALANANTGEIIVSGPAEAMGDIVQAVQGVAIAYDGDVEGDVEGDTEGTSQSVDGSTYYMQRPVGRYSRVDDSGGMGEDISSES